MIQSARGNRFLCEAPLPVGAHRLFRQDSDRDLPLQAQVSPSIDLSHAARAKWTGDLVRPESAWKVSHIQKTGKRYVGRDGSHK